MHVSDYEPMDMGRDVLGVSFLASTLSFPAYHLPLVRPSVGFRRTNTQMRKMSSTNMGPLLVFASTIPEFQSSSLCTTQTVKP